MHVTTGGSDDHMHPETNPVGIRTRSVTISPLVGGDHRTWVKFGLMTRPLQNLPQQPPQFPEWRGYIQNPIGIPAASRELATTGTISKNTFLRIWKWKGAMRVIGHVLIDAYDTLYAPTFRRAASEPPERKLAALIAPGVKLPGVEAATGSTIIHFMHPETCQSSTCAHAEVLLAASLISTERKDLAALRRISAGHRRDQPPLSTLDLTSNRQSPICLSQTSFRQGSRPWMPVGTSTLHTLTPPTDCHCLRVRA